MFPDVADFVKQSDDVFVQVQRLKGGTKRVGYQANGNGRGGQGTYLTPILSRPWPGNYIRSKHKGDNQTSVIQGLAAQYQGKRPGRPKRFQTTGILTRGV